MADKPAAIDQRGADPFRETDGHGIFHQMVMERDNPLRVRKFGNGLEEAARLFDWYESQRVGEGEMTFGVGVEDRHPEAIRFLRGHDHRKLVVKDAFEIDRPAQAALLCE